MSRMYRRTIWLAATLAAISGFAGCSLMGLDVVQPPIIPTLTLTPTTPAPQVAAVASETPTSTASAVPTSTREVACEDAAAFVQDVTLPDGARVSPGARLTKTWRLRNSGTCIWSRGYAVVFSGGQLMNGPTVQALPTSVAPDAEVDITINVTAPTASGNYQGNWQLSNGQGALFGIGPYGHNPFWVQIVVVGQQAPAPTAVPPTNTPQSTEVAITAWRGEYFNSGDLSGAPVLVRNDSAISFDWNNSPGSGVHADNFSARWTRTLHFADGEYRFRVMVDDGVRLWVDDQLLIDEWNDGGERDFEADTTLDGGNHTVRVEYYDHVGDACIHLAWDQISDVTITHWQGEYWANARLRGDPDLVRDDMDINFNWRTGSVVSWMPDDRFSARWTRTLSFRAGTYRFNARVDDGVRLWVDDVLILNSWHIGSLRLVTGETTLTGDDHDLRVEYFEDVGDAQIKVFWTRIGEPTPTRTVTPTPTDSPTPTDTPSLTPTPTDTPTSTPTATDDS